MKLSHLAITAAALVLAGGAAQAQQTNMPPASMPKDTPMPMPADGRSTTEATPEAASPATSDQGATASPSASSVTTATADVSVTTTTLTNGPVPDTAENRAKYGSPMSRAGKRTAAKGN